MEQLAPIVASSPYHSSSTSAAAGAAVQQPLSQGSSPFNFNKSYNPPPTASASPTAVAATVASDNSSMFHPPNGAVEVDHRQFSAPQNHQVKKLENQNSAFKWQNSSLLAANCSRGMYLTFAGFILVLFFFSRKRLSDKERHWFVSILISF